MRALLRKKRPKQHNKLNICSIYKYFSKKKGVCNLFFAKEVLFYIIVYNADGELVEWSKAPHWKCGVPQGTEGSNPSLSAIFVLKFGVKVPNGTISIVQSLKNR